MITQYKSMMNVPATKLVGIIFCMAVLVALCIPRVVVSAPKQLKDHVKLTLRVNGDGDGDSHASIRWGSPDFSDNEVFPRWDVARGTEDTKEFDTSDDTSEFEIQTQGGKVTGYSLLIEIDGKPAIICKFNSRPGGDTEFTNLGVVHTERSGDLNSYGEGNIRINFNAKPNPGPIPAAH